MNNCQFLLDFCLTEADKFGNKQVVDIVECGRPASIKLEGFWYCADHFDEIQRAANCIGTNDKWRYFTCRDYRGAKRVPGRAKNNLDKNYDFGVLYQ